MFKHYQTYPETHSWVLYSILDVHIHISLSNPPRECLYFILGHFVLSFLTLFRMNSLFREVTLCYSNQPWHTSNCWFSPSNAGLVLATHQSFSLYCTLYFQKALKLYYKQSQRLGQLLFLLPVSPCLFSSTFILKSWKSLKLNITLYYGIVIQVLCVVWFTIKMIKCSFKPQNLQRLVSSRKTWDWLTHESFSCSVLQYQLKQIILDKAKWPECYWETDMNISLSGRHNSSTVHKYVDTYTRCSNQ